MSASTIFWEEKNCWTKLAVSIAQSSICVFRVKLPFDRGIKHVCYDVPRVFVYCQAKIVKLPNTRPTSWAISTIHITALKLSARDSQAFQIKDKLHFGKCFGKEDCVLMVFRTPIHSPHEKVALPFSLTSWEYSIYCGVEITITMTLLTSWKWWETRLLDRDIYHSEQLEAIWQTDPGDYDK